MSRDFLIRKFLQSSSRRQPAIQKRELPEYFTGRQEHQNPSASSLGLFSETRTRATVKSRISNSPEATKDRDQPRVFLVDARPHKIDHRDTMTMLAASTKAMTEHKSEQGHRYPAVGYHLGKHPRIATDKMTEIAQGFRIGGSPVIITRRVAINGVRSRAPS